MAHSASNIVAGVEDATRAPAGPPPELLALFPQVPAERWKYIPPEPGTTGGWKVSTGEKDRVPVTETLRRIQSTERMTLAEAIKISVERAKQAQEGVGVVHAGRPDPGLAVRYEEQARELRALAAIAAQRRHGAPAAAPSPRPTPIPRPAARRPAARRSLGARSSPDPGDDGGGESSPPRRRYTLETFRRVLWEVSERAVAKEALTEGFKATMGRCESLLEALERADAEGRTLTLDEALDVSEEVAR